MAVNDRRYNTEYQSGAHVAPSGRTYGYGMGHGGRPGTAAPGPEVVHPQPGQAYVVSQQGQPVYYGQGVPLAAQYVPPATSQPVQPEKEKKRRGPLFWLLLLLAVVAIAAAVWVAFTMFGGGKSARQGTMGQLEGKTAEEIQAELDRVVDDGMFNISIASTVQFPDGSSPGELRIENVPGNRYLMRVVIVENSSGQQIYETDLIEPNYHIQADTLDVALPAGTYDCTATFSAYDPQTEGLIGQAAAEMTVVVER